MSRKFITDGAALLFAEGVSRLLAFSVTFIIAREQGLIALAFLGLAQSILAYATVAGDAGLGTHAVRELALGGDATVVASGTARVQVLLTLAALAIVVPIAAFRTDWGLALALAVVPLSAAFQMTYVLQAGLRAGEIALGRILGNVATAAFGIAAALVGAPLAIVALAYGLGAAVTMLFIQWRTRIPLIRSVGVPSFSFLKGNGRAQFFLAIYTLIVHAYSTSLLILSAALAGGAHLVDTSVATRLLLILVIPAQVLGTIVLPRYVGQRPKLLRDVSIGFAAGSLIAAFVFITAPVGVPLMFGVEAETSVGAVRTIATQVPFAIATTVMLSRVLAAGRYMLAALTYLVALIIQVSLCFVLRQYSTEVFVLSIVLSEAVLLALLVVANQFVDAERRTRLSILEE